MAGETVADGPLTRMVADDTQFTEILKRIVEREQARPKKELTPEEAMMAMWMDFLNRPNGSY